MGIYTRLNAKKSLFGIGFIAWSLENACYNIRDESCVSFLFSLKFSKLRLSKTFADKGKEELFSKLLKKKLARNIEILSSDRTLKFLILIHKENFEQRSLPDIF